MRANTHMGRWFARAMGCLVIWVSVVCGDAAPAIGQAGGNKVKSPVAEHELKAVYLYNFARYTAWPAQKFANPDSPFVIGLLGPTNLQAVLLRIAGKKRIDGREIKVVLFPNANSIGDCHILFCSRTVGAVEHIAAINKLWGTNTLTVGESPVFMAKCIFNFVVVNKRIQIHMSQSAYKKMGLNVSPKLIRISKPVN